MRQRAERRHTQPETPTPYRQYRNHELMALSRRTVHRWRDLDVAQAVALRDWTLEALNSIHTQPDSPREPPRVSRTTWELFLKAEACAIALSRLTDAHRPALPEDAREALESATTSEIRRVLAARAQLRSLGELATLRGIEAVVLKGAVSVAAGHDLTLEDIDLLVRPEDAYRLADALDDMGYQRCGGSTPHHLTPRVLPGSLVVDIHVSLRPRDTEVTESLWASTLPLPGAAGLRRLAASDHAWHVLTHATIEHPDRRGRVRDLLLVADALQGCSDEEVGELQRRIEQHEQHEQLLGMLTMARDLPIPGRLKDWFRHPSALRYELLAVLDRLPLPGPLLQKTWLWTIGFFGSHGDRQLLWAETTKRNLEASKYRLISLVEKRLPGLGRAWILFWRWLRELVVVPVAIILAGVVRYRVRRSGA